MKSNDVTNGPIGTFTEKLVRPIPSEYTVTPVSIHLDAPVLTEYCEALFTSLNFTWCSRGGSEMPISLDELQAYVATLVKTRVDYVNGDRPLFSPMERIVVPSFLSCVLQNVGVAVDVDLGVELRPVITEEPTPFLAKENMLVISRQLRGFQNMGFDFAEGYSRDRSGSWDFMAMAVVEGEVLRHDKSAHGVYALLASTLSIRGVETVLSPRVNYGSVSHFRSLIAQVAEVRT